MRRMMRDSPINRCQSETGIHFEKLYGMYTQQIVKTSLTRRYLRTLIRKKNESDSRFAPCKKRSLHKI